MRRRAGVLLGLLICTVAACGDGAFSRERIAGVSQQVAQAAATITGQPALLATASSSQRHMGFDTGTYPGDAAMHAWRTGGAPYEWAGYYLPSPCHPDESWSGKRDTVTAMGYGLAVLYVGQQTWGRMPGKPHKIPVTVTKKVKVRVGKGKKRHTVTRTVTRTVMRTAPPPPPTASCNADFVSAPRGSTEGFDAADRAEREGFAHGTTVFLDLERMDALHQAMRDYYTAWVNAVLVDGRYRPGIYVHTDNANVVYSDVKRAYLAAGIRDEPPFWVAKSVGFDPNKLPKEMGHAFATVWQGVLDVEQTWAGHKIPIDVNVSGLRNPSGGGSMASFVTAALAVGKVSD
jgi:hypothetical protein